MMGFLSVIRCVAISSGQRSWTLEWTRTIVAVAWILPSTGIISGKVQQRSFTRQQMNNLLIKGLLLSFSYSGHTGLEFFYTNLITHHQKFNKSKE